MKTYQSHKQVKAAQIEKVFPQNDENKHLVKVVGEENPIPVHSDVFSRYQPEKGDYLVQYEDGYLSVSPQKAFEEGYTELVDSDSPVGVVPFGSFSWALMRVQDGAKVARRGWNGKGMFVFLVPGSTFNVNRPPLLGIYPEGTEINYHAHIDMRTADGQIVPWLVSQSDMLANDWEEIE